MKTWKPILYSEISPLVQSSSILKDATKISAINFESNSTSKNFFLHLKVELNDFTIYISEMSQTGPPCVFTNEIFDEFSFALNQAQNDKNSKMYFLNLRSGGVRITHNRSIYSKVWGIVPQLFKLKTKMPLICHAHQMCIGAAAVYFAQGSYRITSADKTIINLTGPGVLDAFFGKENSTPYEVYASAQHQQPTNELIHEHYESADEAINQVKKLYNFISSPLPSKLVLKDKQHEKVYKKSLKTTENYINTITDDAIEIFPQLSPIAPTLLTKIDQQLVGIVMQLKDNPNNLIDTTMTRRWLDALSFFKSLNIALVSSIDSPGADPRKIESDKDLLMCSVELMKQLIEYPQPKMGILLGRCYGGSGSLSLLKEHGSKALIAIENVKLGVMGDAVLEQITGKKEKLRE